MSYIEREYLIEQFEDLFHNDNIMNPVIKVLDVIEIIDTAPSADVVNVVRCKDCNYCELQYPAKAIGEEAIEGYFCYLNKRYLNPTEFCSYGELKERERK